MKRHVALSLAGLIACVSGVAAQPPVVSGEAAISYARPAGPAAPADNAMSAERVHLGKLLFFDPRLSGSGWISCASCHNPRSDERRAPHRDRRRHEELKRHTPTVAQCRLQQAPECGWTFRVAGGTGPGSHRHPGRDDMDMPVLLTRLQGIEGYRHFSKERIRAKASPQRRSPSRSRAMNARSSRPTPRSTSCKRATRARRASRLAAVRALQGQGHCVACHQATTSATTASTTSA